MTPRRILAAFDFAALGGVRPGVVDELVTEGLVTLETVRVLKYAAPGTR